MAFLIRPGWMDIGFVCRARFFFASLLYLPMMMMMMIIIIYARTRARTHTHTHKPVCEQDDSVGGIKGYTQTEKVQQIGQI